MHITMKYPVTFVYSHDSFKLIMSLPVRPKGSFRADSCYYPLEKTEARGFGFSETKSKWLLPMEESNFVTDLSVGRGTVCMQQPCICSTYMKDFIRTYIHTYIHTYLHVVFYTYIRMYIHVACMNLIHMNMAE